MAFLVSAYYKKVTSSLLNALNAARGNLETGLNSLSTFIKKYAIIRSWLQQ
jgi:hypothetical protein